MSIHFFETIAITDFETDNKSIRAISNTFNEEKSYLKQGKWNSDKVYKILTNSMEKIKKTRSLKFMEDINLIKALWDYMKMNHELKQSDCINSRCFTRRNSKNDIKQSFN